MTARITCTDALDGLRALDDNSVDAVVTDPPYGLTNVTPQKLTDTLVRWAGGERDFVPSGRGFMGRSWDAFVPPPALWDEVYRVLKPGGFVTAFAGARTVDLMGMSIRLSGFDVKDMLAWIRSDTFAKSPYALKSAHEPIVLAQKPVEGTIARNIDTWGTGGLNVEACRIPYRNAADEQETKTKNAHGKFGTRHGGNSVFGDYGDGLREDYNPPGRSPGNVLLDEHAAAALDARKGAPGDGWGTGAEHNDVGGPSRFFPMFEYAGRAPARERVVGEDGTKHPTVKPLSVMQWLVRLTCPEGGLVVDPFAGSGTTLEAAIYEGRDAVGFERETAYAALCAQRIARAAT